MEETKKSPAQWLRNLFYLEVVTLVVSLLGFLPIESNWANWPKRVLMAGNIYCMFTLASTGIRYRKAAILRTVQLVLTLVSLALNAYFVRQLASSSPAPYTIVISTLTNILAAVIAVASWIAVYQLYMAHADLVAAQAPDLARKWRNLFPISLLVGLLVSFASMATATILVLVGAESIVSIIKTLIQIPTKVIMLVSIIYLHRSIGVLEKE